VEDDINMRHNTVKLQGILLAGYTQWRSGFLISLNMFTMCDPSGGDLA